jgi:hypothetical protein
MDALLFAVNLHRYLYLVTSAETALGSHRPRIDLLWTERFPKAIWLQQDGARRSVNGGTLEDT